MRPRLPRVWLRTPAGSKALLFAALAALALAPRDAAAAATSVSASRAYTTTRTGCSETRALARASWEIDRARSAVRLEHRAIDRARDARKQARTHLHAAWEAFVHGEAGRSIREVLAVAREQRAAEVRDLEALRLRRTADRSRQAAERDLASVARRCADPIAGGAALRR